MNGPAPPTFERYLAVDLHRHYLVIGGVNAQQVQVLAPRRLSLSNWLDWASAHLQPSDRLVVESTTNVWDFYDQVVPLVGQVLVANPAKIGLIANSRVKTDKQDTLWLARLLAAGLIPTVWVPPQPVRELRALLAHRRRLIQQRTQWRNRLHSVLHRHQLAPPEGDPFHPAQQTWWAALPLSLTERVLVRQGLANLELVAGQVADVDGELERLSSCAPWSEPLTFVLQWPGFGLITGLTLLAAIGEIERFPSAKHLVGYAGLGGRVHDSGQTHRTGGITKAGRREMRWALTEVAWAAVANDPSWKAEFSRLLGQHRPPEAIIIIAHKLLVVLWNVLRRRQADRRAQPERVAGKLLAWSAKLTAEQRDGLTGAQFVRLHLLRLKLGADLTQIVYGGQVRRIAPAEEVLALRPELRATA